MSITQHFMEREYLKCLFSLCFLYGFITEHMAWCGQNIVSYMKVFLLWGSWSKWARVFCATICFSEFLGRCYSSNLFISFEQIIRVSESFLTFVSFGFCIFWVVNLLLWCWYLDFIRTELLPFFASHVASIGKLQESNRTL